MNKNPHKMPDLANLLVLEKKDREGKKAPSQHILTAMSDIIAGDIVDAEQIKQILPDIRWIQKIITSSIPSPNDLIRKDLDFTVEKDLMTYGAAQVMLDKINSFFSTYHNLNDLIYKICEEALFRSGAQIYGVLPESILDSIVNGQTAVSVESLVEEFDIDRKDPLNVDDYKARNKGFLGNVSKETKLKISTESWGVKGSTYDGVVELIPTIEVHDNYNYLKLEDTIQTLRDAREESIATEDINLDSLLTDVCNDLGMEAYAGDTGEVGKTDVSSSDSGKKDKTEALLDKYFNKKKFKEQPTLYVKEHDLYDFKSKLKGIASIVRFPTRAVLPVHRPNDPSDHVGYFILHDKNGLPITDKIGDDEYDKLTARLGEDTEVLKLLKDRMTQDERIKDNRLRYRQEMEKQFSNVLIEDLKGRLANGTVGNDVSFEFNNDVIQLMLARAIEGMKTKILYLPARYVSYMAFDFDEMGIGRSLIEANKVNLVLRTVAKFSNSMSQINNSIPYKTIKITLDSDDKNGEETVRDTLHEYAKKNGIGLPLTTDPKTILESFAKSGLSVEVQGNDYYPSTQITVDERKRNATEVDSSYMEDLKKETSMGFGIGHSIVDPTLDIRYAASVIASSQVTSKTIMDLQDIAAAFLSKHMQRIIKNSPLILKELLTTIAREGINKELTEDNKAKKRLNRKESTRFLERFIRTLTVEFPRPKSAAYENQKDQLENYKDLVDIAVDNYVSRDLLDDRFMENSATNVEYYTKAIKASLVRRFMRREGIVDDLIDLNVESTSDKVDSALINELVDHLEGSIKTMNVFDKAAKRLDKTPESTTDTGGAPTGTNDTGGDGEGFIDPWGDGGTGNDGGNTDDIVTDDNGDLPKGEGGEETP